MSFVAIVVVVEVALLAGAGVMGFFLAKAILRELKPAKAAAVESGEPEVPETTEEHNEETE